MYRLVVFIIYLVPFGLCYVNLADIECGVEMARKGRIVGGTDSLPAEFPWAASLWRQGAHQCGATVISDRWLLTAGHCLCSLKGVAAGMHCVHEATNLVLKGSNAFATDLQQDTNSVLDLFLLRSNSSELCFSLKGVGAGKHWFYSVKSYNINIKLLRNNPRAKHSHSVWLHTHVCGQPSPSLHPSRCSSLEQNTCQCAFEEYYLSKQLSVIVGYTDISSDKENEAVSKIIPHPEYRCKKKSNDVALLKTVRQLSWTNELRPACLPQPLSSDFSGTLATVAGWGFTHEDRGIGSRPNILQKTDVIVVANDECNSWYESQGSKVRINPTQMCAGHEKGGRDSCWADSGGPLLAQGDKGRSMVIGVVSTGSGCARARMPGIYTRVSRYTEWISSNVNGDNARAGLRWYTRRG